MIDINTASSQELHKVSGLGPKAVESILIFIEDKGYITIDELRKIKSFESWLSSFDFKEPGQLESKRDSETKFIDSLSHTVDEKASWLSGQPHRHLALAPESDYARIQRYACESENEELLKRNRELEKERDNFKQEQIRFEDERTRFYAYKSEFVEKHKDQEADGLRRDAAYGDNGYGKEARERYVPHYLREKKDYDYSKDPGEYKREHFHREGISEDQKARDHRVWTTNQDERRKGPTDVQGKDMGRNQVSVQEPVGQKAKPVYTPKTLRFDGHVNSSWRAFFPSC